MGLDARCRARVDGVPVEGRAQLETAELIFRSDGVRVAVPFAQVRSASAEGEWLRVSWSGGLLELHVGDAAAWATRIVSPKSRIDKLGVKPEHRVAVVDLDDAEFAAELAARSPHVVHVVADAPAAGMDVIFFGAEEGGALARLAELRTRLRPAGALWVVRPKGVARITEREVMDAGKAAGLVDVKVVSFSATHTAEKFVIPKARR